MVLCAIFHNVELKFLKEEKQKQIVSQLTLGNRKGAENRCGTGRTETRKVNRGNRPEPVIPTEGENE